MEYKFPTTVRLSTKGLSAIEHIKILLRSDSGKRLKQNEIIENAILRYEQYVVESLDDKTRN